ncbi:MAG TPA: hypothetical protein VFK52_03580 [Nocardioidaceae bacterium]|nr:hypothetical protein [Nocardioidaceae bacterium]
MSSLRELADLLGVPEKRLGMLSGVAQDNLNHLRDSVTSAVLKQENAIQKGVEKSLQAIPRPLRSRARALLFPGGES